MSRRVCGRIPWKWTLGLVAASALLCVTSARAATILVKSGGAGDGSTWAQAKDLGPALRDAVANDELWVAAGTYKPTLKQDYTVPGGGEERLVTFKLKDYLDVYGGFAGTETARDQRDVVANPTILSGDLNSSEGADVGDAFHVVRGAFDATLDGFAITCGYANGGGNDAWGGGLFTTNNMAINQCVFRGNYGLAGGGMASRAAAPTVTNCAFVSNTSDQAGAAINDNLGGGGAPDYTNCLFFGNSGTTNAGAVYNLMSSPTITNCTFSGNSTPNNGGAFYNTNDSDPALLNCILWGDTAVAGAEVYNSNVVVDVPVFTNCNVQGGIVGTDNGGNINSNALYVNAAIGNLRLRSGSPCINSGKDAGAPATDKDGNGRLGKTDIGAYEWQGETSYVVRVTPTGTGDGSSWLQAAGDLQKALQGAGSGTEIWVAGGTYRPTSGVDRTISFVLKNGVALYGNFAGTETSLSQRDLSLTANASVLSGDIDGAGTNDSYHVVTGASGAILDGFTVSGGNAAGGGTNDLGGGMYNVGCDGTLVVAHCIITGNSAVSGGAMYDLNSSPSLTNCVLRANNAANGGAVYDDASWPSFVNCTLAGNAATADGGAIYNTTNSSPDFINCILWGDTAGGTGPEVRNNTGNPSFANCDVQGGIAGLGTDGGNNINSDPLFRAGTLQLSGGSSCLDNADDTAAPGTDILGVARPQGSKADRGAYERRYATVTLSGLTGNTYDGAAKSATVTTTPNGLTTSVTYNGSATAPTDGGSYAVVATVNDTVYSGSASGTLTIGKAVATVTMGSLSQVYDGTAKAATASTFPAGRTVDLTYNGLANAPTDAGSYVVTGTVAASDTNYQGSAAGILVISPAPATVTLNQADLAQTVGATKAVAVTTDPADMAVDVTYNGLATAPNAAGTYLVEATVTDPNYTGSASGILVINTVPTVAASASPASGMVPLEVALSATAADADGDALGYSWDFGDGTFSTAQNPIHTFTTVGPHQVTVTVSDGKGGTATDTVTVTVAAASDPNLKGSADSDGDGFSDEIETALQTNPFSAAATPLGLAPPEEVAALSAVKLSVKLSFVKQNSDAIALAGLLLVPDGFQVLGQKVVVDIGGVVKSFTLDAKGKSPKASNTFAAGVKSGKDGKAILQVAKFAVKLTKGTFSPAMAAYGYGEQSGSLLVPVTVIFNGVKYQRNVPQTYKASPGKGGSSK